MSSRVQVPASVLRIGRDRRLHIIGIRRRLGMAFDGVPRRPAGRRATPFPGRDELFR